MQEEMLNIKNIDDLILIQQYLTFQMNGTSYGLEIINIKEIIKFRDLTEVPTTPDFILGVINLRGRVVPVIDLGLHFVGKPVIPTKRTSIIIYEIKVSDCDLEIGITVDIVNEVIDINTNDIEPSPFFGNKINTKFISGMAKVAGIFLILLNIENVFSADEMSIVGSIEN
ncbi:MAG: purine-binding chemotaxis protein CheW [Paraglaciecola sp.]|jgi:purine-binding chemotaxis protein CheW